ncbi:hypothetical protein BPA_0900002 [Borrelia parkeri SLO]|uniref:Uncharacterized protein n=1 Tax=Borrelia parkeri SLO TaxID=1313294 RepID=A0ABN4C5P1_BORPR|nr:hypothetical protein BPA_0900002 [Borrelia parkeri SLO]
MIEFKLKSFAGFVVFNMFSIPLLIFSFSNSRIAFNFLVQVLNLLNIFLIFY